MEITSHISPRLVQRPSSTTPLLTLLIPSWNNLDYLRLCIDSIRRHSILPFQIVVHVNEGTDGTLQWLDSQNDIDYTYSRSNIGICYALNHARTLAKGEYIVYINDDMYVCPGWDTALMEEVRAIGHPWFFLSATMIEPRATGNPSVLVGDFGSSAADFREADLLAHFADTPKEDWMGATWPPNIVHRDVWDLVGGYSIEFSPGLYSDPDFSMKLWTMGVRHFRGVARSRVYHFMSKSLGRIVPNDGEKTFVQKWGVSSSYLTKQMLRRGSVYTGPAPDSTPGPGLRLKMTWKRLRAALKKV
ncbi:glycosyltransferase family 2 protein [Dinghuibacter silviterrae]|uniref:GT2 family glycosyltransferase n=1 Tax=Dinghuibacter silviterrae TaxID=1539049 RepID=A0A4V3GLK4_9BACT|nr:glycosyltransferase family 2 protein [Dinghuibacter silviterrae]TDW99842.1 GT2 family glycosyltransferase [Dinghuibacter silviterrae]